MNKYTINRANSSGGSFYTVFGKRFADHAKAVEYAEATVERRQQISGRDLDERALVRGVEHVDDMTPRQKIQSSEWRPFVEPKPTEFKFPEQSKPESKKAFRARMEAQYQARMQGQQATSDPKRDKAIEHAESVLERVRFDGSQPASVVDLAERALRQAREGDLGHYKEMSAEIAGVLGKQHAERKQVAQSEYDRAHQRLEIMAGLKAFDVDPPTPAPKRDLTHVSYDDGTSAIIEWEGHKIVARHDPATCDPAILAAAGETNQ